MPLIEFGLTNALDARKDENDQVTRTPLEGAPRVLECQVPDDWNLGETFRTITDPGGIMAAHSSGVPAWVSCPDKPNLEALLAEHYGCAAGKPGDVEQTHWTTAGPPGSAQASEAQPQPAEPAQQPQQPQPLRP